MVQERGPQGQMGVGGVYQWLLDSKNIVILYGLFFVCVLTGVAMSSPSEWRVERVVGTAVIFVILGLAWLDKQVEVTQKVGPWERLAVRTGLRCQVGGGMFASSVSVMGEYRGRLLTMYTPKQGKGQVALTRIEVTLQNPVQAGFRLRGPFSRNEMLCDKVTNEMFQASVARQFGHNQRFFIRSKPVHLATNLMSNKPVWSKLLKLDRLTSIELEGRVLQFEQMGVLQDVDELQAYFDLLSGLADMVEALSAKRIG